MMYRYIIPRIPPSNNKYMGKNKRWAYSEDKTDWTEIVRLCCRPKPEQPIEKSVVTLHYFFKDKRRRDPDNYSGKMLLDGLVRAGVIKDDCFDCIDLVIRASVDREKPRVEITVEELSTKLNLDNQECEKIKKVRIK